MGIIPTEPIQKIPEVEEIQPVQDLMTMAMQSRPELAQSRIQLAVNDIDLKAIRNGKQPDVPLQANDVISVPKRLF